MRIRALTAKSISLIARTITKFKDDQQINFDPILQL